MLDNDILKSDNPVIKWPDFWKYFQKIFRDFVSGITNFYIPYINHKSKSSNWATVMNETFKFGKNDV